MTAPVSARGAHAELAVLANKITRHLLTNPGDQQAHADLSYVLGKLQGSTGATAAANAEEDSAVPRDVGAAGTFVQHAGNSASFGAGNALARTESPDNAGSEMGKVIDISTANNPTAAKLGDWAGIGAQLIGGEAVTGWKIGKMLLQVPKLGRLGLLKILGATVKAAPQTKAMAIETAEQVVAGAKGAEAKMLDAFKSKLFGNRTLSADEEKMVENLFKRATAQPTPVTTSSSQVASIAYEKSAQEAHVLEALLKTGLERAKAEEMLANLQRGLNPR